MKVTIRRRDGEEETRTIEVGRLLVGQRITSVTFENPEELMRILTIERDKAWFTKHIIHSFIRKV